MRPPPSTARRSSRRSGKWRTRWRWRRGSPNSGGRREAQVVALQEAVRLSLAWYETGLSNYIEVLDALQLLYPAENALAQTQRDQLVAVVNLYKALGGGWETS